MASAQDGKWHTVEQGEMLISLADRFGFQDWKVIWDDAQNDALREKRPNPQTLRPGDLIYVPAKTPREVDCDVGKRHVFRVNKRTPYFSIYLKDECGKPYAGVKYELKLGGETFAGQTTADGLVAHPVRPDVRDGDLIMWPKADDPEDKQRWRVKVGQLDPVDSVSGLQARLNNLGYKAGTISGFLNARTKEALRAFQLDLGHDPPSGELDQRTIDDLKKQQNEP